jgi:predicted amidophosphoribosyltransferase
MSTLNTHPRLLRERKTLTAMIDLYCRDLHQPPAGARCDACQDLLDYALGRLERCPFQEKKSTCAKCPVHCYQPEMRERTRQVMRYAGPRMLSHSPYLAVRHLLDGLRPAPRLRRRKS